MDTRGMELNSAVETSTVGELRELLARAEAAGLQDDAQVLAKVKMARFADSGMAEIKQLRIRAARPTTR